MLTTSKAKYLSIGAVLIIAIGFLVVYAGVTPSGYSTNDNLSPRLELTTFTSFLFGGDSGNVNLVSSTDGGIDPAFNSGGSGANGVVMAAAAQDDGKIIIGGDFTSYNGDAAASDYVMRLNTDGTRDETFNPGAQERMVLFGQWR